MYGNYAIVDKLTTELLERFNDNKDCSKAFVSFKDYEVLYDSLSLTPTSRPLPECFPVYSPSGTTSICPSVWMAEGHVSWIQSDFLPDKSTSKCDHVWKTYTGLQEQYTYCSKCDVKHSNVS